MAPTTTSFWGCLYNAHCGGQERAGTERLAITSALPTRGYAASLPWFQISFLNSDSLLCGTAYRAQQALQTCCLARCRPVASCLSRSTTITTQRFKACQTWTCAPGLDEPTGKPCHQLCSFVLCCAMLCCAVLCLLSNAIVIVNGIHTWERSGSTYCTA